MSSIVTIKTLAEEVGFSNETVSHILNGKARKYHHSKETEQKVLNAARKNGYRPNAMAKAARTGRFGQIGFIYCSGKAYLPDSLMQGIQEEIVRRGLHLVLSWITEDMLLKEDSFPKILTDLMVDGLLIDYIYPPPNRIMKMIKASRTPALIINAELEFDCIRPDDRQGGFDAARHLIELGHRKIAFVYLESDEKSWFYHKLPHFSVSRRHSGYCEAMAESGLEPRLILGGDASWKLARSLSGKPEELTPWLFGKDRPSAIIIYGGGKEEFGFYTISRAITKMGLRIPADLSVVTFEDHPCAFGGFTLTTMIEPFYEIGKAAVSVLIDKIEGKIKPMEAIEFPYRLVPGSSCAKNNIER